ncbi:MAG: hypothetical protein LUH14_11210 [Clostridiaceae bacterium]|nr:hypothetical protein [Clostridiaceae bacterium]
MTEEPIVENSESEEWEDGLIPIEVNGKEVVSTKSLDLYDTDTFCTEEAPCMENYISKADLIVKGEITEIAYYEYTDFPWSRLTVSVSEVIKGKVNANRKIAVYVMEGYLYADSEKEELIAAPGDDIGLHEIGDTAIFVVNKEDGSSVFEKGSYRRTFSCFSEYRYIETSGKYHILDTKITSDMNETKLEKTIRSYLK